MTRLTLKKNERLTSKKLIDELFKFGKSFTEKDFRLVYKFIDPATEFGVQVLFSAPKKHHQKAVRRNLIKRLLKEAYRLNKQTLTEKLMEKEKQCMLMVVYFGAEKPDYKNTEDAIKKLLNRLETKL
jgi:ribonuclease P protein component